MRAIRFALEHEILFDESGSAPLLIKGHRVVSTRMVRLRFFIGASA